MSIAIPGLIVWAYMTMLRPMVETLQGVKSAMCSGHKDFVWTEDKNRLLRYAYTTTGFGGNPLILAQEAPCIMGIMLIVSHHCSPVEILIWR